MEKPALKSPIIVILLLVAVVAVVLVVYGTLDPKKFPSEFWVSSLGAGSLSMGGTLGYSRKHKVKWRRVK